MVVDGLECSLSTAELIQRIQEWREITRHALSRRVEGSSLLSAYPADEDLTIELRRLIEAEKDCCSFMVFAMRETVGQLVVELSVPEEMRHLLVLMLELTAADSGPDRKNPLLPGGCESGRPDSNRDPHLGKGSDKLRPSARTLEE
jgi:hypothetical protein